MHLPEELQDSIDAFAQSISPSVLRKARENLSKIYSDGFFTQSVFQDESMRLAYLAARMPATYAAIHQVLSQIPFSPERWLDLGAGPGTASWAVSTVFPLSSKLTLFEKCSSAIHLGKQLAKNHPLLANADWICASLPAELPFADAAIFSYSLGEIDRPSALIDFWWQAAIPLLVVVEPGTPKGFSLIGKIRDQILGLGGFLIAPCPHSFACPLQGNDWCHFSARLQRTRLHRFLKEGFLGFEDEKYSYLIASRSAVALNERARILRHPQKNSGHVRLKTCNSDGSSREIVVSRSDKKFYKTARDAEWGDAFLI